MDDKSLTIGDRLKKVRERLAMNATEFATSINVDQSHYSKVEKGQRNLSEENYKDISTIHGINLNWLLAGEGPMLTSGQEVFRIAQKTDQPHISDKDVSRLTDYLLAEKLKSIQDKVDEMHRWKAEIEEALKKKKQ